MCAVQPGPSIFGVLQLCHTATLAFAGESDGIPLPLRMDKAKKSKEWLVAALPACAVGGAILVWGLAPLGAQTPAGRNNGGEGQASMPARTIYLSKVKKEDSAPVRNSVRMFAKAPQSERGPIQEADQALTEIDVAPPTDSNSGASDSTGGPLQTGNRSFVEYAMASLSNFAAPPPAEPAAQPGDVPSATAVPTGVEVVGPAVGGEVVDPLEADSVEDLTGALGEGQFEDSPFGFAFALREGYDDNLFTTGSNQSASFYTNAAGGVSYEGGNDRLQFQTGLNAGVSYYYTRPGNKFDYTGQANISGLWKVSPRLEVSFSALAAYLAQPDLAIAGGTNRQNGDYFFAPVDISAAYRWSEKFSTQTEYNFTPFLYVEPELNDSQGRISQVAGQAFLWNIQPKTAAVLEYRVNPVDYFQAPLDNFGQFFLVGVDQQFNPKFTVVGRVGAELRFYSQDNNNPEYFGPYGEFTGSYAHGKYSNVSLNLRYGTEASGLNGAATRQTFRIGFNAIQGFTPRLSLAFGLNYLNNYYNEFDKPVTTPNFYENIFEFTAGLNFKLSRSVLLQAGYSRTVDIAPASEQLSYTRNIAFAGVNFEF